LSQVCRGFLCTGDWNDVISALQLHRPGSPLTCVLCEHINLQGSTWTSFNLSYKELNSIGWNDKASSLVCFN
jgi:hypothetical protein